MKNGYVTADKIDRILDTFMTTELKKLVRYSMDKAAQILTTSENGVGLLYLPNCSYFASYVNVALHGMKNENVEISPLDIEQQSLGIRKKYMGGRDIFAFGEIDVYSGESSEKEKLRKIIASGAEMVNDGSIRSFNFVNLTDKPKPLTKMLKRREIEDTVYRINRETLSKVRSSKEHPKNDPTI